MIGRIYIIRNTVNDKLYIGQTIRTVKDRFYAHKLCAKETAKTKFYKAMYEIGVDNFYIETLIERDATPSELTILERDAIIEYNSINNGYNTVLPVGGHYNNVDFVNERNEELINDYLSGTGYTELCSKYNISKTHISRLCSSLKDSRHRIYTSTNSKKSLIMYDKDTFEPLKVFDSIMEAYYYISGINNRASKGAMYYYTDQSCQIGSVAYGHRWQLASDLVYEDKIFRTKFDKEAYIQGKPAYQPEGKQYYIVDGALEFIKDLPINKNKCIDCGKIIKKPGRCRDCYIMFASGVYNGDLDLYECKLCGAKKAFKIGGMCNSCANVIAKDKSPKPSKEELKALLDQGLQKKQIAKIYNRSTSTIHYWINSYGLR